MAESQAELDASTILVALGAAIRRQRAKAGLTQKELAARTGVDRAYLNGIEQGKRSPTVVVLTRLARALGTAPSVLVSGLS